MSEELLLFSSLTYLLTECAIKNTRFLFRFRSVFHFKVYVFVPIYKKEGISRFCSQHTGQKMNAVRENVKDVEEEVERKKERKKKVAMNDVTSALRRAKM